MQATKFPSADELRAGLAGMVCDKMLRAWRNRSNVTRAKWEAAARRLLDDAKHAGALYAACSDYCNPPDWTFEPDKWPAVFSRALAGRLPGCVKYPPEKAPSRGEYDKRRKGTT